MIAEALEQEGHEVGINAAFMSNHRGQVCIAFSDPVYARADTILVNSKNLSVHAILHENSFFIGTVSEVMAHTFENNKEALLTAIRPDGSLLELSVPIEVGNA